MKYFSDKTMLSYMNVALGRFFWLKLVAAADYEQFFSRIRNCHFKRLTRKKIGFYIQTARELTEH